VSGPELPPSGSAPFVTHRCNGLSGQGLELFSQLPIAVSQSLIFPFVGGVRLMVCPAMKIGGQCPEVIHEGDAVVDRFHANSTDQVALRIAGLKPEVFRLPKT